MHEIVIVNGFLQISRTQFICSPLIMSLVLVLTNNSLKGNSKSAISVVNGSNPVTKLKEFAPA